MFAFAFLKLLCSLEKHENILKIKIFAQLIVAIDIILKDLKKNLIKLCVSLKNRITVYHGNIVIINVITDYY